MGSCALPSAGLLLRRYALGPAIAAARPADEPEPRSHASPLWRAVSEAAFLSCDPVQFWGPAAWALAHG